MAKKPETQEQTLNTEPEQTAPPTEVLEQVPPQNETVVPVSPATLEPLRRTIRVDVVTGDILHYVMPNGHHRPAMVVYVWAELTGALAGLPIEGGICNLQVFTDGSNDQDPTVSNGLNERIASGLLWATSVRYSENHEAGTWHWIEGA